MLKKFNIPIFFEYSDILTSLFFKKLKKKMAAIKMIVTDMDGTLCHKDKSMPEGIFDLIVKLHQDHGIYFVVASGRQYYSLSKSFLPIIDHVYFIAENGTMIVQGEGEKVLSVSTIDNEAVATFIKILRKIPNTHIILCGEKCAYYESEETPIFIKNIEPYYSKRQKVDDLLNVKDNLLKIAVLNLDGTKEHVYPKLSDYYDDYLCSVSAFEWIDIMVKDVNKGCGLNMLQKILGVGKENTMAFGDFMNDYEMLQEAKYSFAMKNAIPEIKEIANYVTEYSNEEDGVKKEIEKWMNNKWNIPQPIKNK